MFKGKNLIIIIFILAIPIIIYLFFLKWKTNIIYGDDLYDYKNNLTANSVAAIINHLTGVGKFRPIHGFTTRLVIELFHKNINDYYLFNILMQTISTYMVALILNLFLRSGASSLFFSLIYGLSRFSFYNISQLMDGGVLEGVAMIFFLLSMFFIIKALLNNTSQKKNEFLWGVLFANLSIYTHERYIVLFPFVILIMMFFPGIKILGNKNRLIISLLALLSVILNVAIKKYGYGMPFFVGTGGTNISFSFSKAFSFFIDAVLSIFQINSGPEYLVGIPFTSLPLLGKCVILLIVGGVLLLLIMYLLKTRKTFALKDEAGKKNFFVFLFLATLFVICLVPAVVTIRLEQRWLQASFSAFLVMLIIAFTGVDFKNNVQKTLVFIFFTLLFLWSNHNYLTKGIDNLYMKDAEKVAAIFKQGIDAGTIHPGTARLYIWEQHNDVNADNGNNWAIGGGYLFEFYQGKKKEVTFADSVYKVSNSAVSSFQTFNKDSVQIVYIRNNNVIDITDQYLKDSLRNFQY